MKHFIGYWLALNSEVNLPTVSMRCELRLIHGFTKDSERDKWTNEQVIVKESMLKISLPTDNVWIVGDSQFQ